MQRLASLLVLALALCGLPAAASTLAPPLLLDEKPIVIGQSYSLPSTVLKASMRINVWLPPGYKEGAKRYPVLYLLDGAEDEDFHHISGLAQVSQLNGQFGEMIVVGIVDPDRKRDLTFPSTDPRDLKDAPTSGGSAAFRRYIETELQPAIDARFRTSGRRVIIGESLAGLFIVETFLKQPQLFDGYIAISPSLWWDNGSLAKAAPDLLAAQPPGTRTLYLSIGNEGPAMRVDDLAAAVRAKQPAGLTFIFAPLREETHATIYHPAALDALRKLFPLKPAGP
ncbi:putative alpha/beta superfamily hydrolase [Caulobacter ginsengisoli]|uniref:Alpha/beta superfamily hydrolase n=1 Tax=Caulobacter ginsengisoli TaxID=400775 RepID=A0ABU0ISF8_9CAUL|nr:alpha/beta hydrolase-fold protein [Caulobacter ginsengisoli]MDQ0464355.1 putative alpha/beta superfamily hydrolase [Caulobacter ginsengisoli]